MGRESKQTRGSMRHIEHQHQCALIEWAQRTPLPSAADIEPGSTIASYLLAIPNGGARAKRTKVGKDGVARTYSPEAARLKAEGVKPGVSDLLLPLRRQGFGGLWLEMKAPGERPTERQLAWLERMRLAGYASRWADDWVWAETIIAHYVGVRAPFCNMGKGDK